MRGYQSSVMAQAYGSRHAPRHRRLAHFTMSDRQDERTHRVTPLVLRVLHLVLFGIASRGDREMRHAVLRISATAPAPALLVVAGATHGTAQLVLWGVALAILYGSPLIGHMRGMRVSPDHFVERFGLIIIIALGESIVAIGVGASGLKLDTGVIAAALLGVTVAACLWWSYFDWAIYATQA